MQTFTFAIAALAAIAPAVRAQAGYEVVNKCSYPVYLWAVSASSSSDMQTIDAANSYSAAYETVASGGVSVKISKSESQETITQYEYTLEPGTVWYDLSNINGYPFSSEGMDLAVADSACPQVNCPAGVEICNSVYNTPTENEASKSCGSSVNATLTLCSGGSDSKKLKRHGHGLRHGIRPATY